MLPVVNCCIEIPDDKYLTHLIIHSLKATLSQEAQQNTGSNSTSNNP